MKIYRIAKLVKKASLTLYVSGYQRDASFDSVYNLSNKLNSILFYQWMDKRDKAYFSEFHTVPSSDTITIDGFDVDSPTGTINFYIDGIRPYRVESITEEIKKYLSQNNIKFGNFVTNQSNMYDVPVIRIPITENKTGESSRVADRPPEINMANNNGFFIFNTILKFDRDLWEDGVFDANDLKRRIEYFEGESKLEEGQYAGQGAIVGSPSEVFNEEFLSGKNALSTYDETKVRDVLTNIKTLCEWAINHGYKEVYIA